MAKAGGRFLNWQIFGICPREQLTLHQRATGSTPVRPTNKINDLGHSPPELGLRKTCFKPVSGNRAHQFNVIYRVNSSTNPLEAALL